VKRYAAFALCCVLLGLGLRYHALLTGFAADDYALLDMLDGRYPVERAAWDLYNLSNGSAEEGQRLQRAGYYPWFAHPEMRLSMFRPLASLLMALDHALFGNDALAIHAHTALWWAAMLLAIAWFFARVLPLPVAALALFFYTLDEAHTVPIAWLANRCALSSTLFAVLGLIAYLSFRAYGRARDATLTFIAFALGLGFGEYALCGVAYALAYELQRFVRERGGLRALRRHALALLPVAAPALVYVLVRAALGYGPLRSGIYISPARDLPTFIELVGVRLPVLLADLTFALPSEMWTFGSFWSYVALEHGLVGAHWIQSPEPWRKAHSIFGVVTVPIVLFFYRAVRRRSPELPQLDWLFWGAVIAIVPVVGSFPSSRVLLMSSIGFSALFSVFVVAAVRALRASERSSLLGRSTLGLLACALCAYHTLLPAKLSFEQAFNVRLAAHAARMAAMRMQVDPKRIASQTVLQLAALDYDTSCMYVPRVRQRFGAPRPKACWTISLTPARHMLIRDSATAFRLAPIGGRAMLSTAGEALLSDPHDALRPGDRVDLGAIAITVLSVRGPLISAIRVESDVPLDDPSLVVMTASNEGIRPFSLPPIGKTAIVPMPGIPLH
jgi:hypothetical protein